ARSLETRGPGSSTNHTGASAPRAGSSSFSTSYNWRRARTSCPKRSRASTISARVSPDDIGAHSCGNGRPALGRLSPVAGGGLLDLLRGSPHREREGDRQELAERGHPERVGEGVPRRVGGQIPDRPLHAGV